MSRATAPQSAITRHEPAPGAPAAQSPPAAAATPSAMPAPAQLVVWPPAFRWLVVWAFVSVLAAVAFDGFVAPYLRDEGVSVVAIGFMYGLSGAVGAVAAAIGGVFADRYGRRAVLAAGRSLRLLSWLAVLAFPREEALVLVAILLGLGQAAASALMAMVAESAPGARRAVAFAVTGAVESLAALAVPLAIGFLADAYGLRTALSWALLPGFVGVLLITRLSETVPPPSADPAASGDALGRTGALAGWRFILSTSGRGAALMAAIWLLTGFEMGLMRPVWPLYVTDRFGVTYAGLGAVATVASIGMVFGQLVGGKVAERIGNSRLMVICLGLTALVYLVLPLAATPTSFAALRLLANFCAFLAAPCWGAVAANTAPRAVRGAVLGLFGAATSVGMSLGGLASGLIYTVSIALPLYALAGLELAMLALILVGTGQAWPGFGRGPVHDD